MDNSEDCVVFMTAYKINNYKKNKLSARKKLPNKFSLKDFHIESIASKSYIFTQKGTIQYTKKFDSYKQKTIFNFNPEKSDTTIEDYKKELNNASWMFNFSQSVNVLLNEDIF